MKKPTLKILLPFIGLLFAFIIGLNLRINLIEDRDYWYDEAFTGVTVRQPYEKMMEIIINDVHPPMYYWILRGWSSIAGTSGNSLRIFSVGFGLLTVVLAFYALRKWFPKSWMPATLGAFAFAVNPFLANYSQEARMYTMLGFFILLIALLWTKARDSKHWGWWIAYSFVAGLIMLTHYLGFIFMICLFAFDAWTQWSQHPTKRYLHKHLKWFVEAYGLAFLMGAAWLPFFIKQTTERNSLGWVSDRLFYQLPESFHVWLFGAPVGVPGVPPPLTYRVEWLSIPGTTFLLTLLVTILVTWITLKKRWNRNLSFFAYMATIPALLTWALQAGALQLYVERFLSGTAIFTMLFLIAALYEFGKTKWLGIGLGIYFAMVAMIQPWSYTTTFPILAEKGNDFLEQSLVIYDNPFDYTVGRFYHGESMEQNIKIYNKSNVQEDLSTWAIIDEGDQVFELPSEDHVIITNERDRFSEYEEIDRVNNYVILIPPSQTSQ